MEDGFNMKTYLYIAAALVMLLTGCDIQKDGPAPKPEVPVICGQWKSEELPVDATIYISFNTDKSFELYQHMRMDGYDLYNGTWSIKDNVISGKYNDGEDWAYSYEFEVIEGMMKLQPVGVEGEEDIFTACEIPDVVREKATVVVKSSGKASARPL